MEKPAIDVLEVQHSPDLAEHGRGQMRALPGAGVLTIQGWVLGHNSVATRIELADGSGKPIMVAPVDQNRSDLDDPAASTAGFRLSLSPQGGGEGEIRLQVVFADGTSTDFGAIRCRVATEAQPSAMANTGDRSPKWSDRAFEGGKGKVLFGKEGWLFLRRDTNDILGQHTGRVKMENEQKRQWRRVLEQRLAACERLNVMWSCLVAPDKESLYPEHLPPEIKPAARRPVHDFLDIASEVGAPVKYALDGLLPEKAGRELYSRTDTHWNSRGAYIAYRMFCKDLVERGFHVEAVDEASIRWREEMVEGDLGSKIEPTPRTSSTIRASFEQPRAQRVFDNEIRNHGRVQRFEQGGIIEPTCVLFGESFAHQLVPFLQETFSRLVFVHTSLFPVEVLEREQPDVVLSLPLERFLIRVPDDTDAFAQLHAVAALKQGELPWPSA